MQFLDIIFFALVAAFVIFRLSRTLGSRPDNNQVGPNRQDSNDNVVSMLNRDGTDQDATDDDSDRDDRAQPALTDDAALAAAGIAEIRLEDPAFDANQFLTGAKFAYEAVVTAFAAGDRETLGKLLTRDVLENFSGAIDEREERGETLETTVVGVPSADVVDARMTGRTAEVTVKFVTELMNVIRDSSGALPAGKSDSVRVVTDIWTFVRDVRASDPNWALAETRSPA
ncbi:MAG: Tim44 domain-containing protein [Alphaproteobacteria bacterium]|nr:Tim44 domain-containing protein [Alphaproteobacteria bacterium]MBT4710661.1 Tim44 domain-containing protein [Alphaproteobacteria bacterium]MBT5860700.1 Tim44 domain-containing protein [Alphaproteobacteria bacterium]